MSKEHNNIHQAITGIKDGKHTAYCLARNNYSINVEWTQILTLSEILSYHFMKHS